MTVYRHRSGWSWRILARHVLPWLAAGLGVALFVSLGFWQLDRAAQKKALIEAAAAAPKVYWPGPDGDPPRFTRLTVSGRFDPERHLLLDNQILNGRYGAHVLTPLITAGGRLILVNRGWLPLAADRRLPEIPTPEGELTIFGRVNDWPAAGIKLGEPDRLSRDRWPQLVTYLDSAAVAAAYGDPLPNWLLQLDSEAPGGFAGRSAWPVVNFGPKRHQAYALTWFTLALGIVVISLVVSFGPKLHHRQATKTQTTTLAKTGENKP